jgi:uncharacterized protein YecT (DUF1311 family)
MKQSIVTLQLVGLTVIGTVMCGTTSLASCPGLTQVEMNECAAAESRRDDAELNRVYSKLVKSPELIAAERAWVAYRDAECAYEHAIEAGGSIASMEESMCRSNRTKERIKLLKENAIDGR